MKRIPLFGHHISKGIREAWASGDSWERLDALITVAVVYTTVASGLFKLITYII